MATRSGTANAGVAVNTIPARKIIGLRSMTHSYIKVDRAPLGISFHLYSSAVKPASALAMDEAPLLFLRHFAGLNACSGDLVPGKALRSDRFRQRLKLPGGYEAKLLRGEIKGCHSGRCCAACCKGEHDQRPHYVSFPFPALDPGINEARRVSRFSFRHSSVICAHSQTNGGFLRWPDLLSAAFVANGRHRTFVS